MRRYRITTPEPGWEGKVGVVSFVAGAAECEADADAAALYYFHSQGYGIEPLDGGPVYAPAGVKTDADRIAELEAELATLRGNAPPPGDELAARDVNADGVVDELPRRNADTTTWRTFAVQHGMDQTQADTMSRDDLVAFYTKEAQA